MVKKVIKNFDSSRAAGPNFIPVVVLNNFEPPNFLYILAEIFNMWLKESCFRDYWKLSLVVPVFKNVWESSAAKKFNLVSRLSVDKVFEELVNNR